ncbi:MAG: hypothetical protein KatS3mg087_1818 [Patescibacteria group bacterium]|nr:MAG: hypothetical protein KatS3mg087_1818 [Patescibacteria group bacterium]
MSFARFSSNNFGSDVYCYESVDGYFLHVASKRFENPLPPLPDIESGSTEDIVSAFREYKMAISKQNMVRINGPYDGKTFRFDSAKELLEKLKELSEVGYRVPEDAINAIEEYVGSRYSQVEDGDN